MNGGKDLDIVEKIIWGAGGPCIIQMDFNRLFGNECRSRKGGVPHSELACRRVGSAVPLEVRSLHV